MKKNDAKATINKAQERITGVVYRKPEEINNSVINPTKDGGAFRYELADGITLGIVFTDGDVDFGFLDFFGLNVSIKIRTGKNGQFVSFPSYKAKDGSYKDEARVFDKNFHECVRELLALIYE